MDQELLDWLEHTYDHIIQNSSSKVDESVDRDYKEKAVIISNYYFLTDYPIQSFSDIYHFLLNIYPNSYLSDSDDTAIIEHLLVYSVTETDLEKKQECLEIITKDLDQTTQAFLIGVIQDITNPPTTESPSPVKSVVATPSVSVSVSHSAVVSSQPQRKPLPCDECFLHVERMKRLEKELEANNLKHQEEMKQIKQSLLNQQTKMVDEEVSLLAKNTEIFHLQQQITQLSTNLEEYHEMEIQYAELQKRFTANQDEIELLKEKAEKTNQLESNYQKLRDKYEELIEIKQQLKMETTSHQETYQKLIEVEKEVQELRKLKPLVEEYKKDNSEKTITINDISYQLSQKETKITELTKKLTQFENNYQMMMKEREDLSSALSDTSEELRFSQRHQGIGEGINEFNPILMQELIKLREENGQLKETIQQTAVEELQRLRKECNDQATINQSLIMKWNQTKEELQAANEKIVKLEELLLSAQIEISTLQHTISENQRQYEETLILTKETAAKELQDCKEEHESIFNQLQEEHASALASLQRNHNDEVTTQQQQHVEEINRLKDDHHTLLEQLKYSHQIEMQQAKEKYDGLMIDHEEEKNKRRKIERLKKMFESESQRQKLQLSALQNGSGNDGSSNQDLQAVAKEMKTMQEQLNVAHTEIHTLKSLLESSSSSTAAANHHQHHHHHHHHGKGLKASSSSSAASAAASSVMIHTYLEHAEVTDKRIEQLEREKRDILSRSLEDNKEKMELSQKLLCLDKENNTLRTELRKIILEKERIERKLLKESFSNPILTENKENLTI